jgi:DNA-binding NarL/FixJ family response regulator
MEVLVVMGHELGWPEVGDSLLRIPEISRVLTASSLGQAIELAGTGAPDAVIMGPLADFPAERDGLLELRHAVGLDAPIIVIASEADVDLAFKLGDLGITAYFLWTDLTTDSLSRCLAPAIIDGMTVGSRTIARAAIAAAQYRVSPIDPDVLTVPEQSVLQGLSKGLTETEIAAKEFMSVRSVRRAIMSAKQKLGAPNLFVLGMAFTRLASDEYADRIGGTAD